MTVRRPSSEGVDVELDRSSRMAIAALYVGSPGASWSRNQSRCWGNERGVGSLRSRRGIVSRRGLLLAVEEESFEEGSLLRRELLDTIRQIGGVHGSPARLNSSSASSSLMSSSRASIASNVVASGSPVLAASTSTASASTVGDVKMRVERELHVEGRSGSGR